MNEIEREIGKILRSHDKRVTADTKKILKILNATRREILADVASTEWEAYYQPKIRAAIEDQMLNFVNKAREMIGAGQIDMWSSGAAMTEGILSAAGISVMMPVLPTSLLNQLKDFSATKIQGLSKAALERVNTELVLGMTGGKTPYDVMQAIGRNLKNPGIFTSTAARAEVIVREEYGRTFSAARQERMMQAKARVPGLQKIWRHAGHPKIPRESHLAAHGQVVDIDEPFLVGGERLMYPRDPAGSPENTINCGCQSLPHKEEWGIQEAVLKHGRELVYS